MQNWLVYLCCAALSGIVLITPARAESVRTSDGRIYNGYVQLDGSQLVVETTDGKIVRLDLSRVALANISHGPRPVAPSSTTKESTTQTSSSPLVRIPAAPNEIAHGLKGEYFDGEDLTSRQFVRLDPQINMDWRPGIPAPHMLDRFSARWTGQLTAPVTGNYTISFHHDDGARIWLDNKLLLDVWAQGSQTQSFVTALTANKPVPIRIEYYNNYSDGNVLLQWALGKKALQDVPSTALTPPADFDLKNPNEIKIPRGHGIYAEYFNDMNMQGPLLKRIEPNIDLTTRGVGPDPHVGNNFAARWTGFITPPQTDDYTFTTMTRDGVRLWINGKLIIDHFAILEQKESATARLEGGKPVSIKMEFFDQRDVAIAKLYWESPQIANEIIPSSALTPATPEMIRSAERDNGLLAQYFTDDTLKTRCLVRYDPDIDFDWNSGTQALPGPGVPERFGVQWTGKLIAPVTGRYSLSMVADDNERVYLDGKLIIDAWDHGPTQKSAHGIELKAGESHDIKVEMSNRGGGPAAAHLYWQGPNIRREIIPGEDFRPPDGKKIALPEIMLDFAIKEQYAQGQPIELIATPWVDQGDSIKRVDFLLDGAVVHSTTKAPWTFSLASAAPGHHFVAARVVDQDDLAVDSGRYPILVATDASVIEPGWNSVRIGDNPAPADTLAVKDGVITVGSAPGEILSNPDSFHFVEREMVGNARVVVHLAAIKSDKNNAIPFAGLMIRENLKPDCDDAAVFLSGTGADSSAAFLHRDTSGRDAAYSGSAMKGPYWLKIERVNQHIETYISPDEQHWFATGTTDVIFPDRVYVGLFVSVKGEGTATAIFDHLKFSNAKDPVINVTAALQTIEGSILPCKVESATPTAVQFIFNGKEMNTKPTEIARLLLAPISAQVIENLPRGHTGAILPNGDFAEGDLVHASATHVSIMSLIFGPQHFSVPYQAIGVVLHDCNPPHDGYAITTTDNAVYCLPSIQLANSQIKFTDPIAGEITLDDKDIQAVSRVK